MLATVSIRRLVGDYGALWACRSQATSHTPSGAPAQLRVCTLWARRPTLRFRVHSVFRLWCEFCPTVVARIVVRALKVEDCGNRSNHSRRTRARLRLKLFRFVFLVAITHVVSVVCFRDRPTFLFDGPFAPARLLLPRPILLLLTEEKLGQRSARPNGSPPGAISPCVPIHVSREPSAGPAARARVPATDPGTPSGGNPAPAE